MTRSTAAAWLILVCFLAGIGWTLTVWSLGEPEAGTCAVVFPACQERPILTGLYFLLLLGLSKTALPGVPFWPLLLVCVAWAASGHLMWPM